MELNTEKKMTQAKNYLLAVMDGFRMGSTKSEEESALCIAAFLYLRRNNGLTIKSEKEINENKEIAIYYNSYYNKCLCYNRSVVENEKNKEFRYLLGHYIIKGSYDIDSQCIFEFVNYLNGNEFDTNELLCLLDYATANANKTKISFGSYSSELNELIGLFLKRDSIKILDPYGNMLGFVTQHPEKDFVVNEINGHAREVGLFKLAIAGLLDKTKYLHINNGWEDWNERSYDAIVTIPPFGLKVIRKQLYTPSEDAEDSAFKFFLNCTNEKGQMVTVVPVSFLSSERGDKHGLREIMLNNDWLESVIVLPECVFHGTSISTALIVLDKGRRPEKPICFVDGSKCFEKNNQRILDIDKIMSYVKEPDGKHSIMVSKEDIFEENSSWLVGWYLFKKNQSFNETFDIVELNEILKPAHAKVRFDETSGHLIDRNGLLADSSRFEFKPNDFAFSTDLTNSRKITEPVIIVMSLSDAYPLYCEASETNPVFIKASISAYKICIPNVHIGFLCLQLNTRIATLKKYVNLYYNRSVFNNIVLGFPKLGNKEGYEEQRDIFEEANNALKLAKAKELGLQKAIDTANDEYLRNIHARKHAMMQNTSSLALAWDNLLHYLEGNNGVFNQNDVIGRKHPISVGEIINSISTNIRTIDNQAQHLTEVEYDWGEVDEFFLQDFIVEYITKHKSTQFNFLFLNENSVWMKGRYADISEYWYGEVVPNRKLKMPKNALKQVFDNIVSNAISHGFTEQGKAYYIDFDYEYEFDDIVLEISNNGEPMAEGVDTKYISTYGSSTKLNSREEKDGTIHSGIGGYEINNILKKYNAELEVVSVPEVCYRITFHNVINSNIIIDVDE